jgi:hypothetical protein
MTPSATMSAFACDVKEKRTERSVVSVNRLSTVVLIVRVTPITIQTRQDLSSNTNSLSDLEFGNIFTDVGNLSNDFVSWNNPFGAQGTPTTSDGVNIGSTDLSCQLGNEGEGR